MILVVAIAGGGLALVGVALLVRLWRGPSEPSRLLAMQGLLGVAAAVLAVAGLAQTDTRLLLASAALAALGPSLIQAFAHRIEHRARAREAHDA